MFHLKNLASKGLKGQFFSRASEFTYLSFQYVTNTFFLDTLRSTMALGQQAITWANADQDLASLGHNELRVMADSCW